MAVENYTGADHYPVVAQDKLIHLLGGAIITLALGYVLPVWVALAAACAAGFLKEVYDRFHPETNTRDLWDFLAAAGGGLVAAGFVCAVVA